MKRNTLTAAVFAGLTGVAGMVSVSHAVNLNPDGLGQVLLYPYYTARGGNDTLISVVNTTTAVKAVKVRFIEALNSREVLDFNLYLSPFDVWTAAVTATDAGGAQMITTDNSCTVPYFVGASADGVGRQNFLDFFYTGSAFDGGPSGIERTASGYFEMIEMGTLINITGFPAAQAATHNASGVPTNGGPFGAPCSVLQSAWANGPWGFGFGNPGDPTVATEGSTGGLFGAASIINVDEGTMFSYNATAIDSFYDGTSPVAEFHTDPGSTLPNLNSGATTSNVFINGVVDTQTWPLGLLAVNATITFDNLFNEYTVNPGPGARTEWVVTFPTKRQHTDNLGFGFVTPGSNTPIPPFTNTWAIFSGGGVAAVAEACETFNLRVWDREEREPETGIIVSPPPPQQGFELCREANVIRFTQAGGTPDATEILKEPLRANPNLTYTNFQLPPGFLSGWVQFDLATVGSSTRLSLPANSGAQYAGLPTIGFAVNTFTNGATAAGVLANYGGTFNHRGSRSVVFSVD